VEDQGVGIAEDQLQAIFNPFERGQQRTGQVSGSGLGLAIARQIMIRHRGDIWVESTVGVGSRFMIRLPIKQAV
jgi:two-component system sensor histidine kinase ChiS